MPHDNRDYPNSGILFRANRKDGPRSRDYRGEGRIDCPHCGAPIELWLSAWLKTARNGARFLSLSFKPKDARPAAGAPANNDRDGDIPF